MLVLALRTDKPEAELYLLKNGEILQSVKWQAHRELSDTIHLKIKQMLDKSSIELKDLKGLVYYIGPGSFTGLRIGAAVGNALAYAFHIPIAGSTGPDWVESGLKMLAGGNGGKQVIPEYGAPAATSIRSK